MNRIVKTRKALVFIVFLMMALCAKYTFAGNGNELVESMKKPLLSATVRVPNSPDSYADEVEVQAIANLRSLLTRLNKKPLVGEFNIKTNKTYASALGGYDTVSTGGLDGWDYDTPLSMPIIVWDGSEPSVKYIDHDRYLVELSRYSNSEIVGYFVEEKSAYVVLSLLGQTEFQIFELAWSIRSLPYSSAYFFQISSDPIPETRATVFSSEFLKKLQAKLLDNKSVNG